jgi:hypothetical protein
VAPPQPERWLSRAGIFNFVSHKNKTANYAINSIYNFVIAPKYRIVRFVLLLYLVSLGQVQAVSGLRPISIIVKAGEKLLEIL